MFNFRFSRIVYILVLLVLASPFQPAASAWSPFKFPKLPKHKKHQKNNSDTVVADEPDDRSDFTKIIFKVIANEWQMRGKMQQYSPRIETYLQYYKPDSELGDLATSDDYFLGRLKFGRGADSRVSETSFIPERSADWVRFGHG